MRGYCVEEASQHCILSILAGDTSNQRGGEEREVKRESTATYCFGDTSSSFGILFEGETYLLEQIELHPSAKKGVAD